MKRYFPLIAVMLMSGLQAQVSVKDTKHNLSVSSTATIKAQTEQEICVFCHTPHKATSTAQLWNHTTNPAQTYLKYTSSTFSLTYAASFPRNSSMICLSCHDGTIALGSTYNTIGSGSTGMITMSGGVTTMPVGESNLGTDLRDDHPISANFTVGHSAVGSQFNCSGCHYPSPSDKVPMECVRCHDPHNDSRDAVTKKFLYQNNQTSALCMNCHNKPYWTSGPSIHKTSVKTVPTGWSHTGYTTVVDNGCENCHKPHAAASGQYILKGVEQATCEGCHKGTTNGGITAKNVSNFAGGPFAQTYGHPTYTVSAKHNPVLASPVTNSPTENSVDLSLPNRHAECYDCHNSHAAKSGLHTLKSNALSNVLSGVWGLEAAAVTNWTQPTTFTRYDPATTEYQICLKCHSYNGLGSAPAGVSTIIGPSGNNITDQAMEYNINNRSVHSIKVGLASQTGSVAPRALVATQMNATWNSVGTQTMYCSDCHGNDQTVSATVPDGPHGSARKFMLKGTSVKPTAQYWPLNAGGVNLWTLRDIRNNLNSWSTNLFCVGCHSMYSGGTWYNVAHKEHENRNVTIGGKPYAGLPCVSCHTAVPHGSKRGRLITYVTDVSPYAYRDGAINVNVVSGFKKATGPNNYAKSNCYSLQNGCTTHSNAGGYDP